MSKITLLSIAIAGLILVNLGLMAFLLREPVRQHAPDPERHHHEGPKQIIIERLHFDDQQVASYEQLITAHRTAIYRLDGAIRQAKNDLYSTLTDTVRSGKDSLLQQLNSLQHEVEVVHYKHFEAIRQLCRPGQLAFFAALTHDLAAYFSPEKNNLPPPKDH